jgi:WD40 repeat protein
MGQEPGLQPRRPGLGRRERRHRIRIWDAAGGDLLVELSGHGNSVNDIAFSQGLGPELLLASAGDRTVRLWNLTGRLP